MLKSITLKEYTTFIKETTFDFSATNYKILENTNVGSNRILKGALFVGENASGKTQVLQAIVQLLDMLIENSEQNYLLKKSLYTKGAKYSLKYVFDILGNEIKYEVEFDGYSIINEKLLLNNEVKIERINNSGNTYFGEKKTVNDINLNLSFIKNEYYNTRFNNNTILNEWFLYLKNSLYVNCLLGTIKSYNPLKVSEQILKKYAEENNANKLNELLKNIGYNSEVIIDKKTSNEDKSVVFKSEKEAVFMKKIGTDVPMPLSIESTGNQALMNIILPINYAIQNNCMLIIDEFSSGLHNELEETLIKYFFNNSKDSQLFFTTHSTNVIDTELLRPDQIYSFRFDSKKGTLIKRFSDENPRESQNMEKMYLNGVFDGMPKYNK